MPENESRPAIVRLLKSVMIAEVPSFANKIFYSLGFLSMVSLIWLIATGSIMVFFGPDWWLTNSAGTFVRSLHLWSAQAFIFFIILHAFIVFLTSGFRLSRRLTWVFGALMFFAALTEAEFGYALRHDFSSQWRALQAADLYNGAYLGRFINNLNYAQIYGIHVILIPFIILFLLFLHYGLVRLKGIAPPYKAGIDYRVVAANHRLLFWRGGVLTLVIFLLAVILPSPLTAPVTIQKIAQDDPKLLAQTLLAEFNHTSDTAEYFDTINPYNFDTREVYVVAPFRQIAVTLPPGQNYLTQFSSQNQAKQEDSFNEAKTYFEDSLKIDWNAGSLNPLIMTIKTLVKMAQSGLYEKSLLTQNGGTANPTDQLRLLSDTGVLEAEAGTLKMTTAQYGMLHEEKGGLPGAWWLAPLGFLDNTILKNDANQDRDGAIILGLFVLLLVAFPYIPYLNRLPDKLGIYKLIWKSS
ncbi:MAG: cytochrome b N-terminal domain-containing protein [Patescibacteria group bacterium]|nr:cytochrome b N-terminal domain-containing protein [Patescibacteria group bacterium]